MKAIEHFTNCEFADLVNGLMRQLDRQGAVCLIDICPMDMEDIMQSMLLEHFEAATAHKEAPDALESLMHALRDNNLLGNSKENLCYELLEKRLSTNTLDATMNRIALEEVLADALTVWQYKIAHARYIEGIRIIEIANNAKYLPSVIAKSSEDERLEYVVSELHTALAKLNQPKYLRMIKG